MKANTVGKYPFPWRDGNRFGLLVDGAEIFPAMFAAVDDARHEILLEMYLVESGDLMTRFIEALLRARQREVKIYLLLDDFGARGLSMRDRRRMTGAGIECVYYNPLRYGKWRRNLLRDHRKLMVVDNRVAFVGGIGITDEFDRDPNPKHYWHDVVVQVEGPNVLDWYEVFRHNWKLWTLASMPLPSEDVAPALSGDLAAGHVVCGRRFGAIDIQRSFIRQVLRAKRRVWVMTAYFAPSLRLRLALRGADRRGVDVRLLLPGPITDHPGVRFAGRRFYASLLLAGVRIYEYQPRFLHGKVLLCDDWVSIGSSNLDRWNLRWNLEGNQEVRDAAFADGVRELFEADFARSDECLLQDWQRRSWLLRVREWFWGKIDILLENLGRWLSR